MNAFIVTSLVLDRRPATKGPVSFGGITVLVAAYEEQKAIARTMAHLSRQRYPGPVEVLVLNDGSTDLTTDRANAAREALRQGSVDFRIIDFPVNRGKAAVLNHGLLEARHDLIVTVDGDTALHPDALRSIAHRLLSGRPNTAAVAGAVLAANAGESLVAGAQEWDYFHGIAAVKRMQSMYHGTLVAQGAFSIYRRAALLEVGGWPDCVGEDIVLTWALHARGYRIGYAEDALVFTDVPTTFRQFALQRKRWARGLIEAFHHHPRLLLKPRLTTLFVWWNLLFLSLDLAYTLIFIPGVLAAIFLGVFWIAGPLTIAVLPLAALWNLIIYRIQSRTIRRCGIRLRHNYAGLALFLMAYTLMMQPVCVWGYWSELLGRTKRWGTR
jgi:biofilm PGA synthesis N-glycosyltransferase PgaC